MANKLKYAQINVYPFQTMLIKQASFQILNMIKATKLRQP